MDKEDDSGSFLDNKANPVRNVHENDTKKSMIREDLLNARDVSYLGPVFIGTPKSQGAMVVYDTGSDWLTVKSCITENHCNKKIDKKKTLAKLGIKANSTDVPEEL